MAKKKAASDDGVALRIPGDTSDRFKDGVPVAVPHDASTTETKPAAKSATPKKES